MVNDRTSVGKVKFTQVQVSQWSEDAQKSLQSAQKLCSIAQTQLNETYENLGVQLPNDLEVVEFLFEGYQRQLDMVGQVLKRSELLLSRDVDSVLVEIDSDLNPKLKDLSTILKQMENTIVPDFVQVNGMEGDKRLYDFLAMESTQFIQNNIEIYKHNCKNASETLNHEIQLLRDEQHKLLHYQGTIQKEYELLGRLQLELKLAQGDMIESKGQEGVILKENRALENELVSLLEMMTNHYDQCKSAVELLSRGGSTEHTKINLDVLEVDSQELGDVFKELKAVSEIISTNSAKSKRLYKQYNEHIVKCTTYIKEELEKIRLFKTNKVPQFLSFFQECKNVFSKCSIVDEELKDLTPSQVYAETISQLVFHYTKFLDVYKTKYLAELHHEQYSFPKKFLKRIEDFINDEVYRMQSEEINHRKRWLDKYEEFIPKEFQLPGEQEIPMVVQVITEGLEHIQRESGVEGFNQGEEKRLLDLMKRLRTQEQGE